jgi:hypothetical protein
MGKGLRNPARITGSASHDSQSRTKRINLRTATSGTNSRRKKEIYLKRQPAPEKRVLIRFKYEDDWVKEWSDLLRPDDTDDRCLHRAMNAVREYGMWQIRTSGSNAQGKELEVSKKKETITMRYTFESDPEVKEIEIGKNERSGSN